MKQEHLILEQCLMMEEHQILEEKTDNTRTSDDGRITDA